MISAVAAIVLLVLLLSIKQGDVIPAITDRPEIRDDSSIEMGSGMEETPISESVIIGNETGVDFYVDEKGVKHYVVKAVDKPALGN